MPFYAVNVKLVNGKLDYTVPNFLLASRAKYKWSPANQGIEGTTQALCGFEYPDTLVDTADRTLITEGAFLGFANATIVSNKAIILANGIDFATVTATFPEVGGNAIFKIIFPDGTTSIETIAIGVGGIAILGPSYTATTDVGIITVNTSSDTWFDTAGYDQVLIEAV